MNKMVLWLVAGGLAFLMAALYLLSMSLQVETVRLQSAQQQVQATLQVTPRANPTDEALQTQLIEVQMQAAALENLVPTMTSQHVNWSDVMMAVGSAISPELTVTQLGQVENHLTITGYAIDESRVMGYAIMLQASQQFETVTIQSLRLQQLTTPFPTGTDHQMETYIPVVSSASTPYFEFIILAELKKS